MATSFTVLPNPTEKYEQALQDIFKQIPPEFWPAMMEKLFKLQEGATIEASAVTILNLLPITMFGRRIKNPHTDPLSKIRKEYDIHPYSKQGSGASSTLAYTDPDTGEIHVLLARKKNDTGQYEQVGGYTKGHWGEGGEKGVDRRSDDKKDHDEETLIHNKNAVSVSQAAIAPSDLEAKYTLAQIKPPIRALYTQMVADSHLPLADFQVDPKVMKQLLAERGFKMQNQFNAEETALDEVLQETGIDLRLLGKRPKAVSATDDFCLTNESEKLHTVARHFVVNLGLRSDPLPLRPGSDIGNLVWAAASEISLSKDYQKDPRATFHGSPIRLDYGLVTLSACLRSVRNEDILWQSRKRFSTVENVEMGLVDAFETGAKDSRFALMRHLLGYPPKVEVGVEAHLYHLRILQTVSFLLKHKTLDETRVQLLQETLEEEMRLATKPLAQEHKHT